VGLALVSTRELRVPLVDGIMLEALLDEPTPPVTRAVLLCAPHPAFGGRMDTPLMSALAEGLSVAGWAALRFHYRGIEGSGGVPTGGLVEHEDVEAASAFLRARYAEVAWVGYSFGALMALRALSRGRPVAYAGVALPTNIIGDDLARIAEVAAALGVGVPSLFISGDDDPICEVGRVRGWCQGFAHATVETLPGEGHGFSCVGTRTLVERVRRFVDGA
jgi:alpha/beta superfamily hydrolase